LHGVLPEMQTIVEARLKRIGKVMNDIDQAYERELAQLCQSENGRREVLAEVEALRQERSEILLRLASVRREVRRVAGACAQANERLRRLMARDREP
jgi:chromosome segregation ATPase